MKRIHSALAIGLSLIQASAFAVCQDWTAKKVGNLEQRTISEASGVVLSKEKPNKLLWNNDSGNRAELFATDMNGKVEKTVSLSGFSNTDFEALSLGPCISNKNESCIYVGDIGDGIGWRSNFKIGIFKEKDFWANSSIRPEKVISYSYPNRAENAEGMVVTNEGKIFIFSKDGSGISQVYSMSATSKMAHLGQINLNDIMEQVRGKGPRITDASISADGKKILLLTYGDIAEFDAEVLFNPESRRNWRKGIDYNVIKGPELPQQETLTYLSNDSFLVSTESPDGEAQAIYHYTCSKR